MNTCLSLRRTKVDRRYRNILFRNEARNIRARSRVFFVCKKNFPAPGLLSVWGRGMCEDRLLGLQLDGGLDIRPGPGLKLLEPAHNLALVVKLVALGQGLTFGLELVGIAAVGGPGFAEVSLLHLGDLVAHIALVLAGLVGPAMHPQTRRRPFDLGFGPGQALVQCFCDFGQRLDGRRNLAILAAKAGGQGVRQLVRAHVTQDHLCRLLRHCVSL